MVGFMPQEIGSDSKFYKDCAHFSSTYTKFYKINLKVVGSLEYAME